MNKMHLLEKAYSFDRKRDFASEPTQYKSNQPYTEPNFIKTYNQTFKYSERWLILRKPRTNETMNNSKRGQFPQQAHFFRKRSPKCKGIR